MTRFFQPLTHALVITSTVLLTACGGGGGSSSNAGAPAPGTTKVERYAIAAAYNGGTLSSYAVEPQTGLMRLVDKKSSLTNASAIALRPGHDEVIALSNGGAIYQYALSARGELDYMQFAITSGGGLNDVVVHPSGDFVYVADATDGIFQLDFDEEGNIALMEPDDAVVSDNVNAAFTDLALSRNGKHLYAADINNGISRFSVGNDGSLTFEENILFVDSAWKLIAHPKNNFLYAIERTDGYLRQYEILSDGSLKGIGSPVYFGTQLEDITINKSGSYLYISDLTSKGIWQFSIAGNGLAAKLLNDFISVPSDSPRVLKSSPVSNRIYLSDQNGAAMLAFAVTESGELSPMTPDRVAMDGYPIDLVFTTGTALKAHTTAAYVINGSDNDISQFLMDDAGSLTTLGDNLPETGNVPTAIAMHPNGKYFYVANYNDNSISQYRRVTSANLDFEVDELRKIQNPAIVNLNPAALAVHPSGNFLYVVSKTNGVVNTYKLKSNGEIEDNNGIGAYMPDDIMELDQDTFGFSNPAAIAMDPAGRFLWVSNDDDIGVIVSYAIDGADGTLTKLDDYASAGDNPRALAINATGTRIYTTATADNSIRWYAVDEEGILTYLDQAATGQSPVNLVMAPKGNALYIANLLSANLSQFAVGGEGELTAMNPATVDNGTFAQGIAMDPTSRNLLVTNPNNASISRYRADSAGKLTIQESVSVGINPQGVAITGYTE